MTPFDVVGIVASAGGLETISVVLADFGPTSGRLRRQSAWRIARWMSCCGRSQKSGARVLTRLRSGA